MVDLVLEILYQDVVILVLETDKDVFIAIDCDNLVLHP